MESELLVAKAINVTELTKRYSADRGLGPVNFALEQGTCCAVIGANGSGKTTLLRCLIGLELLDKGSIGLGDLQWSAQHIPADLKEYISRKVGVVFQNPEPWPHLSVLDNVALPLQKVKKLSQTDAHGQATAMLKKFGLGDRLSAMPHQLSGGYRQRVVQARALALNPQILILDEPTSALDPVWTEWLAGLIREYKQAGNSVIVVSHQIGFVKRVADQVIYLDKGLIKEAGTTEQVLNYPVDPGLQLFLSNI